MAGRPILRRTCAQPVLIRVIPENEIPRALRVDFYSVFQIFGSPVHLYARGFPHFVCRAVLYFASGGFSVLRAAGLFRVFCLPPVRSCFLRVYGALSVLRTGGFFLVLQAMWFARRAADGGMRRPSSVTLWHIFPRGGGKDMEQTPCNSGTRARRSTFLQGREHGRGVPYVCKGKEYGRCVPHLCTRTVSAFVHGRGIRR